MGCIGLEHRGFLTGVVTHLFHVCREHNFHRALAPQSCADDMKSMTGAGRKKDVVLHSQGIKGESFQSSGHRERNCILNQTECVSRLAFLQASGQI